MSAEAWRPSAGLAALRRRAELLAALRAFFAARGVMEVETPLLGRGTVSDPHLHSLSSRVELPGGEVATLYLQTSPEFAMKRLLAAGSGPIYQIGRAFRDGESGRLHNPEFTMLEWYRPGFDHHRLMDEVEELLCTVVGAASAVRMTYRELFLHHLAIDPHRAPVATLAAAASAAGTGVAGLAAVEEERDTWLQLLMATVIEPRIDPTRPLFVHDFPASQAALARLRHDPGGPPVAERFEVYLGGAELANGFHELADPVEQRRRFAADLAERRRRGLPVPELDERLLAALAAGLPPCAGVALGVDRLAMLAAGAGSLAEVVAFPIDRA